MEKLPGYEKPKSDHVRPRGGKAHGISDKSAATVQITAEQILREAHEYKDLTFQAPQTKISDQAELEEYKMRKRKEYEEVVRRSRHSIGVWLVYAEWESSQKEWERCRSIYERSLEVDYRNPTLWLKYAEFEMKNRFVNHARNVWDRAVTLMPRHAQFWFKFAYMEEMLGNVAGARQIFERWMQWEPDNNAWNSYIKLEMRHGNADHARGIMERWLICHNEVETYIRFAKFEEKLNNYAGARQVMERASVELGEDANDPQLFIFFAQFEERMKEPERARAIYKYALDHVTKSKAEELYKMYTSFEKQHGHKQGVEDVILSKRRFQYEEQLKEDATNYDVWFDYIKLEENGGDQKKIRTVFERAIANIPPINEKRFWKRYIYIWINFALYEELVAKDLDRTKEVYKKCLEIIPHKAFTFAKLWIMHAHFELRRKDLTAARKVFGMSLGMCPKESVFKQYIELEMQLGNFDRCRTLYEKYLQFMPENCYAWSKFAELESSLSELERARGLFELAIAQPVLDMPEVLWKAYIDFEIKHKQVDRTRKLYTRLLERTKHVKVWISRAQFEATSGTDVSAARAVFQDADKYFQGAEESQEERVMLLEAWRDYEKVHGTEESLGVVVAKMPKRVKKKRQLIADDGAEAGWEEYYDYIFPDQEGKKSSLKILEMARKWKKQKTAPMEDE